jgi:hypothetical protein
VGITPFSRRTGALCQIINQRRTKSGFQQVNATPEVGSADLGLPVGERTYTMFIQTARAGTWEPKAGEEGVFTLTLTGLPAQTVYFSDRPDRVVGTQTTSEFLEALGFGDQNPPNAALVTAGENGDDDILVIELFNPDYTESLDEAGGTLVYEARILENYQETRMGRVALEQDDAVIPSSFAGASLFIDDCSDGFLECHRGGTLMGQFSFGCCYKFPSCHTCHSYDGICTILDGCEDGSCTVKVTSTCAL